MVVLGMDFTSACGDVRQGWSRACATVASAANDTRGVLAQNFSIFSNPTDYLDMLCPIFMPWKCSASTGPYVGPYSWPPSYRHARLCAIVAFLAAA